VFSGILEVAPSRRSGAAAFLKFLDDDLGAKHDIVDTKQFEDTDFVTAAAGAILD
jgi:hypothetical protein